MRRVLIWVTRVAECISAMALAAIFLIFLLQIFTRYASKISMLMPIPPVAEWMSLTGADWLDRQSDLVAVGLDHIFWLLVLRARTGPCRV